MISIAIRGRLPPHADRVFLDRNSESWRRLPESMRQELEEERDEVAEIRASIAKQAVVDVMPPVVITGDAWVDRDYEEYLHVASGVVEVGRAMQFGVKLSGASTLLADGLELRELLLHGFNHCFWLIRHALQDGAPPEECRSFWLDCRMFDDENFEERLSERPADWFGDHDVQLFKWRARDLFLGGGNAVMHEWVIPGLPCTEAPSTFPPHDVITIDPEVADHCEGLNARDLHQSRLRRLHQR